MQHVKKYFQREKSLDENSETNEVEERYLHEPIRACIRVFEEQIVSGMSLGEPIHINME